MGKKKEREKGKKVQNLDVYSRINFLYQVAHLSPSSSLSRFYLSLMQHLALRSLIRLFDSQHFNFLFIFFLFDLLSSFYRRDSLVKRTFCKRCKSLLITTHSKTLSSSSSSFRFIRSVRIQCIFFF